jgi:hypothetical protein
VRAFALRPRWWSNLLPPALLVLLLASPGLFRLWVSENPSLPWDSFALLGLWLWCGWDVWAARDESPVTQLPVPASEPTLFASGAELGQPV